MLDLVRQAVLIHLTRIKGLFRLTNPDVEVASFADMDDKLARRLRNAREMAKRHPIVQAFDEGETGRWIKEAYKNCLHFNSLLGLYRYVIPLCAQMLCCGSLG